MHKPPPLRPVAGRGPPQWFKAWQAARFPEERARGPVAAPQQKRRAGETRRAYPGNRYRALALVDLQRDEAQIPLAVDEEQDRFAPGFARVVDLRGDLRGVLHLFLRHLDDEIAGAHALFRGGAVGRDV